MTNIQNGISTGRPAADALECPPCSRCGATTRIYGIEPNMEKSRTDVHTFVCDSCETVQVRVVPVTA